MRKLTLVSLILLAFVSANAQCLDTLNFPNLQPPCNPDFIPVCGCDGVTYKNRCFADFATVQQYVEGPCEQVAMNIFPNPSTYWLNVNIVTKFEADVNFYIFDRNGNIFYYSFLRNVTSEMLDIPVYGFEQGLYIVMAESNGVTQLSKIIRWEE